LGFGGEVLPRKMSPVRGTRQALTSLVRDSMARLRLSARSAATSGRQWFRALRNGVRTDLQEVGEALPLLAVDGPGQATDVMDQPLHDDLVHEPLDGRREVDLRRHPQLSPNKVSCVACGGRVFGIMWAKFFQFRSRNLVNLLSALIGPPRVAGVPKDT
jgi:hypothetical protein